MAKREHGHRIQVTFFVPVDPDNLENTIATSTAVDKAERGDFSGITGAVVLSFKRRYTSRVPEEQGKPEIDPNNPSQQALDAGYVPPSPLPDPQEMPVDTRPRQIVPTADGTGYEPAPDEDETPRALRRTAQRGVAQ